jgi:hypothetical protein
LSNVTRGTVLAGRYRLEERLQTNPDGSVWRAVDATLDRKVSIRVMRPGHPFAADVADAARRAALIDDPRLVRVLDVSGDGDITFVVSEHVDGDNLATLVERSPLAAPVVRRIIGEVAQGLAGAATRGLHHLRLTPRSVIVCYDGTVKVIGTAVEAAAAGLEPAHAASASRSDAIALIALMYSGLTGRWPLGDAGFPPAPRTEGGGPVPPADLVPGVPNDLDTLCVVTLGPADDGPRSPVELIRQIAPWPTAAQAPLRAAARPQPADRTAVNPALLIRGRPSTPAQGTPPSQPARPSQPPRAAPPAAPAPGRAGGAAAGANASASAWAAGGADWTPEPGPTIRRTPGATGAGAGGAPGARPAAAGPPPAAAAAAAAAAANRAAAADQAAATGVPVRPPGATGAGRPAAATGAGNNASANPGNPANRPEQPAPRRSAALFPTPSVALTGSLPIPPKEHRRDGPSRMDTLFGSDPVKNDEPAAPTAANNATAPTTPRRPGNRPANSRPAATPIEQDPAAGRYGRPNAGPARTGDSFLPWNAGWAESSPQRDALESGPFPIVIPPEAPPREQSRLVIFSVIGVLILGLLLAAFSLRNFGGGGDSDSSRSPVPAVTDPAPAKTGSAGTGSKATPSATASATAVATAPIRIASIRALDPQGDGDEYTASSALAIDGDPSTMWQSDRYRSAVFGGLKKGVGLAIRLRPAAAVKSVTINVQGDGGQIELRTSNSLALSSSTVVGKATFSNGRATIRVTGAIRSKYVILWFTELPSVGSGGYRAEVSEVRLK